MKIFDFDKLLDTLTGYLETKLELFKIEVKEEVTRLIAKAIIYFVILLLSAISLLMGLVALAIVLNDLTKTNYMGFVILFALITIISIFLFSKKERILEKILKHISKQAELDEVKDE